MTAAAFARALDRARKRAGTHEATLRTIYQRTLTSAAGKAARSLVTQAALTASDWQPPPEGTLATGLGVSVALRDQQAQATETVMRVPLEQAGIAWEPDDPLLQAFLQQTEAWAGASIEEAFQPELRKIIADAFRQGLSVKDAAALIRARFAETAPWQAEMLARSNLNMLGNGGMQVAVTRYNERASAAGEKIVETKTWVTAGDAAVRPSHVAAAGQTVPVDQSFQVGGSMLMFPGDPGGALAQVLNCRCVALYGQTSRPTRRQESAEEEPAPQAVRMPSTPGEEIPQAETYYHGTGSGPPLTVGNDAWDSRYFITPDRAVAERYAERHIDGEVQEVALDPDVRVFRPEIDPIDYTPEKLVGILQDVEASDFGAVHFGGGIGTVVLKRSTAKVVRTLTASASLLTAAVPSPAMASMVKKGKRRGRLARKAMTAATIPSVQWVSDLAFEGTATADGRFMLPRAISWRELPLTLMAMTVTDDGHDGAFVAGRIDKINRSGKDIDGEPLEAGVVSIRGGGVFDMGGENGAEIARLVGDETLRGVSVDLAVIDWAFRDPDTGEIIEPEDLTEAQMERAFWGELQYAVRKGELLAATVCPTPAFADARIALAASGQQVLRITTSFEITDRALVAAAAPVAPPRDWFYTPEANGPAALIVTDEGHVYGHAALWGACHTGFPGRCFEPQPSPSNYAYFNNGEIVCADGDRVGVGQLTMRAFHASLTPGTSADQAKAHYENTGVCAADVRAVDGVHGVWISGAVRPHLTDADVRELRGAKVSGDWRQITPGGPLEMIGALEVNTPGFPVPRPQLALAASAAHPEGEPVALIAAGVVEDGDYDRRLEILEARLERGRDGLAALIG